MHISPEVFDEFYNRLRQAFVEKELNGKYPPGVNATSPAIWDVKRPGEKEPIAQRLFQGRRAGDPRVFWRKRSEIRTNPNAKIDPVSFVKGLEYIGVKPPEGIANFKSLIEEEQVEILYKQFSDRLQTEKQSLIEGKVSLVRTDFDLVDDLISKFYHSITNRDYRTAWDLMAPEFQNRKYWYGDYEKFRIGYKNTGVIREMHAFNHKRLTAGQVVCTVYYQDEVFAHSTKELDIFESLRVDDLDDFVKTVTNLRDKLEKRGLKGFEKIELCKLFEPATAEYIWYTLGVDATKLDDLFDSQKTLYIKRLYDCTCGIVEDQWKLLGIRPTRAFSVR